MIFPSHTRTEPIGIPPADSPLFASSIAACKNASGSPGTAVAAVLVTGMGEPMTKSTSSAMRRSPLDELRSGGGRSGMTSSATPSPGARFRAALAEERPLQIVGTINAYGALLATRAGYRALYLS